MNNAFCCIPWIHSSMDSNGDLRVCCICKYPPYSYFYKKDGSVYNAKNDKVPRNHNLYKKIRASILKNKRHPLCKHCEELENVGLYSNRQAFNNIYSKYYEDIIKYTDEDGTIDESKIPLVYYDLRLGNKCNCKCIMCDSCNSSMWGELNNWTDINLNTPYLIELIQNAKNIKTIYFTGGEPMINEHHWKLLNIFLENSYNHIVVDYNSNGVYLKEDMFKVWSQFHSVNIGFSIDGINEIFEQIRIPAKWKTVEKNLKLFDKNASESIRASICVTVSSINILNIIDLYKWFIKQNFKWIQNHFHFNILHIPDSIAIGNVDLKEKEMIKIEYEKFYLWLDDNIQNNNEIKNNFKGIINALSK